MAQPAIGVVLELSNLLISLATIIQHQIFGCNVQINNNNNNNNISKNNTIISTTATTSTATAVLTIGFN